MTTKLKVKVKDVPSESKPAAKIADELEAEARRLLGVAKILRGGPFVTYPKKQKAVQRK